MDNNDNSLLSTQSNDDSKEVRNGHKVENEIRKNIKKIGKKTASKGKLIAAFKPVIFFIIVAIVIIVILIGIIMFFITIPGMAIGNLKKVFNELGNYVAAFFGADVNSQVDSDQIFNTLDYIEDMGYDLKGFGFLTDYYSDNKDKSIVEALDDKYKNDYKVDSDAGVVRSADGNVILAKSDFIFTYICSDNYAYTLKNTNLVTEGEGLWGKIFGGIQALVYKLHNFFFYKLDNLLGITKAAQDAWGKGLISIYYQGGQVGEKGDLFSEGIFNFDTVRIDTGKRQLILKKGELFGNNKEVKYNLENWTGRYGMPLEFLLSVHIATMMPDLAYDMATAFPTNVNMILNPVEHNGNKEYQPYISEVVNHWYRDVYFVINQDTFADKNIDVIDYDYDYQATFKERWTLYETYAENDINSGYKEYAKENYGNFKLYILNDAGEYISAQELGEIANNPKVTLDINNDYIYLGTSEEAKDDNIIVSKKAVSLDITEDETFEDVKWNKIGNNWTAYKIVERWDGDIKQVGEGLRTETNPRIKKMFLKNTYFRYDGGKNTAEIITALRKKIKKDYFSNNISEYGALNALTTTGYEMINGYKVPKTYDFTAESGFNREYTSTELNLDDKYKGSYRDENGNVIRIDKKYKVSDYIGQVSLNQDSLNAFTMLENMHTLDADYIYRDFKELIVELGYFKKEELTSETPRLLEWPIPKTASLNYPERGIDKRENEYGTTIHSKGDIDAYKAYAGTKILDTIPTKIDVHSPDLTKSGFYKRATGEVRRPDGSYLPVAGDMFIIQTEAADYKINGTNDKIAENAKKMWFDMANVTDQIPYKQATSGFASTFKESLKDSSKRNVNDAVFVAWLLKNMGIDVEEVIKKLGDIRHPEGRYWEKFEGDWTNPHHIARLCVESLGGQIIYTYKELQPGDIMAYVYSDDGEKIEHIDVLGEQHLDGSYSTYGCGVIPSIGETEAQNMIDEDTFIKLPLCFGIRISEDGFEGYLGNEMVVSPVTGILLEYGTYDPNSETGKDIDSITKEPYRVNTDIKYGTDIAGIEKVERGDIVSDKVGYAKILVLDIENYLYLEQSTANRWSNKSTDAQGNIVIDGTKKSNSLVTHNNQFREELIDDDDSTAVAKVVGNVDYSSYDPSTKWNKTDQTVYAYKEFTEKYESAGIAGNIVIVDGFVCESPDEKLVDITKNIPYENDLARKNASKITIEKNDKGIGYKNITPSNLENPTIQLPSQYIEDEYYDLNSEKAMSKNKAEVMIKYLAAHSIYIEDVYDEIGKTNISPLIFIKEGTILGRTMTDKELLESSDFRAGKYGTYEQNREVSLNIKKDGEDKIIGNYLRVMMRDKDKTVVEDVEDYYKLGAKEEFDWFSLLLWEPHEAGGVDIDLEGPECFDSCTPGELAVGIAQWTDLLMHYQRRDGNGINALLKRMVKNDYDLCWPLEDQIMDNLKRWRLSTGDGLPPTYNLQWISNQFCDGEYWDGDFPGMLGRYDHDIVVTTPSPSHPDGYGHWEVDSNGNRIFIPDSLKFVHCRYTGNEHAEVRQRLRKSDLQLALTKVCKMDREKFFRMQRQFAKECFIEPTIMLHPWLLDRPISVLGVLLHWVDGSGDYEMKWLRKEMTDEEILLYVRNGFARLRTTMSDPTNDPNSGRAWSEPEIAFKLLDGTITKYIVEIWVRTGNSKALTENGVDYR